MVDRLSNYPNRIKLLPVQGQNDVYDVVRMDMPLEEGTPLNKSSLLSQAAVEALGLIDTDELTPSDAIEEIGTKLYGSANAWITTGSYTGDGIKISSKTINCNLKPKMFFIFAKTVGFAPYNGYSQYGAIYIEGLTKTNGFSGYDYTFTVDGNNITLTGSSSTTFTGQLNYNGYEYVWVCIGTKD